MLIYTLSTIYTCLYIIMYKISIQYNLYYMGILNFRMLFVVFMIKIKGELIFLKNNYDRVRT